MSEATYYILRENAYTSTILSSDTKVRTILHSAMVCTPGKYCSRAFIWTVSLLWGAIRMRAIHQCFHINFSMVLFIILYGEVLTFDLWMEFYSVTIQMKAIEQHFPVVLSVMLYKVVLNVTFESPDEILGFHPCTDLSSSGGKLSFQWLIVSTRLKN